MAEAIFGGLYQNGYQKDHLRIAEPLDTRRDYLTQKYTGTIITQDNHEAVKGANIVILAVKPQVIRKVVTDLAPSLQQPGLLIISVAGGIETTALMSWIGTPQPIVRIMPNTPALIGQGAVGLFATDAVTDDQKQLTESVLGSVSKILTWVDKEPLIDSVTGVSGSGPAYFFLFMEAISKYYSVIMCHVY